MEHLVYCDNKEKVLKKIIEGNKTMVIRGAAGRKIPHSRVFTGEILYFIEKGSGLISAKAPVISVQNYVKLSDEEITDIIEKNQQPLNLSDTQKERWHKKCLCLIQFGKVEIFEPLKLDHQTNMDDWLILDKIEDVVEGTSKAFNYENAKFIK